MTARIRFLLFSLIVLVLPGVIMASPDPQLGDLGKLVLILSPAIAGTVLNLGLGRRGEPTQWRWIGFAALITLAIAGTALATSLAADVSAFDGVRSASPGAGAAMAATALTSLLEELGWAAGGLALALKAFGRRWGVVILGLVWAAWHLVPTFLKVGLFPELEAASPLMLASFVVGCVIYRELLTRLVERSGSWLGAAAGHAAPNIMFAGFAASGLVFLMQPEGWPLYPAPGGVVFTGLALAAVWLLRRRGDGPAGPRAQPA